MKILLFFFCTMSTINSISQQPFEGTIVYRIYKYSVDNTPPAELTAMFGKNAIRVSLKENNIVNKEDVLIRIDSARLYYFNREEHTFKTKPLSFSKDMNDIGKKTFAGYTTHPFEIGPGGLSGIAGLMFGGGSSILHISDDLYYPVPDKYSNTMELIMVNHNKIVLGVDFKLDLYKSALKEHLDTSDSNKVSVAAISITPGKFSEADFSVPPGFIEEQVADSSSGTLYSPVQDSIMTEKDTNHPAAESSSQKNHPQKKQVKKQTTTNKKNTATLLSERRSRERPNPQSPAWPDIRKSSKDAKIRPVKPGRTG